MARLDRDHLRCVLAVFGCFVLVCAYLGAALGKVLITGSSGLIGTALCGALAEMGTETIGLDTQGEADLKLDIRELSDHAAALQGVHGIVHLAAVSRVMHGERDPVRCTSVNIDGTRTVLETAAKLPSRPWVIYASSREVYGEQAELPVHEDSELRPLNVYARSKLSAEKLTEKARADGVRATIVRFSSVYGSVHDHADRVVPAFARAAARGGQMRVDGFAGILDLTHVNDVSRGLLPLMRLLDTEAELPPPIHFVSGNPMTLGGLAELAVDLGNDGTSITEGTPRDFDVHHFYGDPSRAASLLGWRATTGLREGFSQLIDDFRVASASQVNSGCAAPGLAVAPTQAEG
jgi:UDP-glucose 4-epimerase